MKCRHVAEVFFYVIERDPSKEQEFSLPESVLKSCPLNGRDYKNHKFKELTQTIFQELLLERRCHLRRQRARLLHYGVDRYVCRRQDSRSCPKRRNEDASVGFDVLAESLAYQSADDFTENDFTQN